MVSGATKSGPSDVRLATIVDGELFASIHARAFAKAEAWSRDVFTLQLGLPNVVGLVWRDKALILVRFAADEAEILTVAVAPSARRRGIGTLLLDQARDRLAAAGATVLFLEVSVKNTAGIALYTRFGFAVAGRRRRYYSDGSDALVMKHELTGRR
jgi:ribosomal-protein-alanine N-acetyltransferase